MYIMTGSACISSFIFSMDNILGDACSRLARAYHGWEKALEGSNIMQAICRENRKGDSYSHVIN